MVQSNAAFVVSLVKQSGPIGFMQTVFNDKGLPHLAQVFQNFLVKFDSAALYTYKHAVN